MPMSHLRFTLKCMPSIKNLVRNLIPEGDAGAAVFTVIDTETTGLNKRYDRIIELVNCPRFCSVNLLRSPLMLVMIHGLDKKT